MHVHEHALRQPREYEHVSMHNIIHLCSGVKSDLSSKYKQLRIFTVSNVSVSDCTFIIFTNLRKYYFYAI